MQNIFSVEVKDSGIHPEEGLQADELQQKLKVGLCILLNIIETHRKQPQVVLWAVKLTEIPLGKKTLAENTAWL